jgi:protein-tyrosine phosphatase
MANRKTCQTIKSFDYSELHENFLYLGSRQTSKNLDGLRSLQITHIVNLAGKCHYPSEFTYGMFHIEDGSSASKIDKNLPLILQFIDRARQNSPSNRVLIHCRAGLSRTPFIAVAYLMHWQHLTLLDAFDRVKTCRTQMRVHDEHLKVLLTLDDVHSCTLDELRRR